MNTLLNQLYTVAKSICTQHGTLIEIKMDTNRGKRSKRSKRELFLGKREMRKGFTKRWRIFFLIQSADEK